MYICIYVSSYRRGVLRYINYLATVAPLYTFSNCFKIEADCSKCVLNNRSLILKQ